MSIDSNGVVFPTFATYPKSYAPNFAANHFDAVFSPFFFSGTIRSISSICYFIGSLLKMNSFNSKTFPSFFQFQKLIIQILLQMKIIINLVNLPDSSSRKLPTHFFNSWFHQQCFICLYVGSLKWSCFSRF